MKKLLLLLLLFVLLIPVYAFSATHYVSSTGASDANAWADSTDIGDPCAYTIANANADAGDTVYYLAGTYTVTEGNDAIGPQEHTGTSGNPIIFSTYNGEVIFNYTGSATSDYAINLDAENYNPDFIMSYVKVYGLSYGFTFNNFPLHLWIRQGDYNEISNCSITGIPTDAASTDDVPWSASYIYRGAQYNWVHDSVFGDFGWCTPYGTDHGVVFQVGLEEDPLELNNSYNLIENNIMYHGGHHVVSLNGNYNVFRNNYFYNDPWCPTGSPVYATRTFFQTGGGGNTRYNLAENNRIGYGGPKNKEEIGGAGGSLAGGYNIWRYNTFVNIYTTGIWVDYYPNVTGNSDVVYNKVYNNTFWHGGYGDYQKSPGGVVPSGNWDDDYTHGICIDGPDANIHDNVFKNNIFYQNNCLNGTDKSIIDNSTSSLPTTQILVNNWFDDDGDPEFEDITGTADPDDEDQYDFFLKSTSGCRDNGVALTTITSATGSGTSFVVADSGYFFYDWGNMSTAIPNATIQDDHIAIGDVGTTRQITNIDYSTDTITVDSPVSWDYGDSVWLYKDSEGTVVLVGSAPDQGANEYGVTTQTTIHGITLNGVSNGG